MDYKTALTALEAEYGDEALIALAAWKQQVRMFRDAHPFEAEIADAITDFYINGETTVNGVRIVEIPDDTP